MMGQDVTEYLEVFLFTHPPQKQKSVTIIIQHLELHWGHMNILMVILKQIGPTNFRLLPGNGVGRLETEGPQNNLG